MKILEELYGHNILIRYTFYISVWIMLTIALFISQIGGGFDAGISNAWLTFWMILFVFPLLILEYITIKKRQKNNINIFKSIKEEKE